MALVLVTYTRNWRVQSYDATDETPPTFTRDCEDPAAVVAAVAEALAERPRRSLKITCRDVEAVPE